MSRIDEKEIERRFEVISKFEISPEVTANDLERVRETLTEQMSRRQPGGQKIWRIIMKSPITKLAAAAVIIIAVFWGLNKFNRSISFTSSAWADVVNKFQSVKFFSATIYLKENIASEPTQIELWMNKDGRTRLLSGKEVVFAENANIVKAFDIQNRKEIEVDKRARLLLKELLGSTGEFSLGTFLKALSDDNKTLSDGNLEDITPMINSDEIISQDIVVFDIQPNGLEWCRIWALQESKLPIRIKLWTPMDGGSVDVVLTYSKQQSDEFFDPQAFLKVLTDSQLDEVHLAYMFLKDPAQKKISPLIPDEQKAFEIVTQTTDGKPWSLGDYKGKAVLMTFWSGYIQSIEKYKEVYNKFGKRDDFIMVGVNLDPSVESVKTYCQKEGIEWLQLHESIKPWKNKNGMVIGEPDNKLAKALGITYFLGVVLVKKDGSITKISNAYLLDDCVKALLSDMMFCPTQAWFTETIRHKGTDNGDMTKNEIEQMFGKPDSIETAPNNSGQIWKYEAFLEEWSRIVLLTIYFDNTGRIVGVGNQT